MRGLLLALVLLTPACVHKPVFTTYRLVAHTPTAILVPPGVASADTPARTLPAGIAVAKGTCAAESPLLAARKKRLTLSLDSAYLSQQKQPGWLTRWALDAEAHGCIPPGSADPLAQRILEAVPLDPSVAYNLIHASSIRSGFVELGAESRLEVRSPVEGGELKTQAVTGSGSQLTVDLKPSPSLIGFDLAWWALRPNAGGPGVHFEPLRAERTLRTTGKQPLEHPENFFHFPPEAVFFRLYYKSTDNGVTAIVVSGATRAELDRRTQALDRDIASCEPSGGMCLSLPHKVGINPFQAVMVNGKEVIVQVGGTVRSAIQTAGGQPASVLPTLSVTKPYAGVPRPVEFDRASEAILNMPLSGSETIAW